MVTCYWLGKQQSAESNKKRSESLKGRVVSEETRKKLSTAHKGRVRSKEHSENISKAKKGKPLTEAQRRHLEEMTALIRGKKFGPQSEEHKKHESEAHKGAKVWNKGKTKETDERIAIQGSKLKGRPSPLRGRPISEEHRRKISEYRKTDVVNSERICRLVRPTKPQLRLFGVVKERFAGEDVVLDHVVKVGRRWFCVDVAVPGLKLGYEYDEPFWHQDRDKDIVRHCLIESLGWDLVHYSRESQFLGVKAI